MNPYQTAALEAIVRLASERRFFTSDDLYEVCEVEPDNVNQVGKAINSAQSRRIIRFTGSVLPSKRRAAKGRMVKVWTGYRRPVEGETVDEWIADRVGGPVTNQGSLL